MKNKSLAWQILSFAVVLIGIYGGFFGDKGQQILGIVSFAITALLQSPMLASGSWPKGWGIAMWTTQVAGVVIQVANYLSDNGIFDSMVVNVFILTVNAILTLFVKDYASAAKKA
jgi:hypothetical protein